VKNEKKLVLATAFLLLPLLATDVGLAAPGKSHKGGNGKGNVKTRVDADLQPPVTPSDPTTAPEGDAEYAQKVNKNVDRQGFKARVEIPGISDEATARAALVEIRLSQGVAQYATCLLDFDSFEEGTAEYKLDVRYHSQPGGSPKYREHAGSCDVVSNDPTLPLGTTIKAVPAVLQGDTANIFFTPSATSSTPAVASQILTGLFD
jgi:hypothetical protein